MNKDYIDITKNKDSYKKQIMNKVKDLEQKYVREHKPFCFKAARDFVEDLMLRKKVEIERKEGNVDFSDLDLSEKDFERFGYIKNFKHIGTNPIRSNVIIDGIKQEVVTGHFEEYVWKDGGYGVSVEVPIQAKSNNQE